MKYVRERMTKEKLTLSVDKEVVKKAKKLGINISEITEKVLRGFTFTPTGADELHVRAKYKELFDTMVPLLQKYSASVVVADVDTLLPEDRDKVGMDAGGFASVELCPDGTLYSGDIDATIPIEKISVHEFSQPQQILSRFIYAISEGAERTKERLKEIEMAKRIISAIAGTVEKTPRRKR